MIINKIRTDFFLQFDAETIHQFKRWVYDQLAEWYKPSEYSIEIFMYNTLKIFVSEYKLSYDVSWIELLEEWDLDEPFMDFFGD